MTLLEWVLLLVALQLNGLLFLAYVGWVANRLGIEVEEFGIGIGFGEYQGANGADATQNFARSGSATFLTGVAFDDKDGDRFYDPGEGLGKVSVSIKSSAGATTYKRAVLIRISFLSKTPLSETRPTFETSTMSKRSRQRTGSSIPVFWEHGIINSVPLDPRTYKTYQHLSHNIHQDFFVFLSGLFGLHNRGRVARVSHLLNCRSRFCIHQYFFQL